MPFTPYIPPTSNKGFTPYVKGNTNITPPALPTPKTSLLGNIGNAAKSVGNFVASSEIGVGQELGQSAAVNSKDFSAAQDSAQKLSDMQLKIQKLINEDKAQGRDTSRLEATLASTQGKQNIDINKIAPRSQDSTGTALKNLGGVALDVATAGTYGAAVKGAKTGELLARAIKPTAVKVGEEALKKGATAVKGILPKAKSLGEKALSLSQKELSAVDKSKLKYLTDKGFDMAKTEGGFLKDKMYKMTDQVKSLAKEFSNVLTGKTPEENIKNVQTEIGRLQQQSKTAFEGANKAINKNSLVSGIKKAIENMSDSVYEGYTKEQQASFSDKRIGDFLSYVKDGTLKGLDDGLEAFRSANAKSDATISKAADTTYQAVKKYIVDNLPEDKAAIYKAANQSQAKLFDVAEILKGKLQASIGTVGKAGNYLRGAAKVAGGVALEKGLKQVPGLGWLP